jgi:hypothetical protein
MIATMSHSTKLFEHAWAAIQNQLRCGKELKAWSVKGRAKTSFEICCVTSDSIYIQPQNGNERRVPRSDFEKIFQVWSDYKGGRVQRQKLRDISQNSTYVITVLHWIETEPAPKRTGSILGL